MSKNRTRKSEIYTPDVMQSIQVLANENITISELLKLLNGMYPDKKITDGNLRNVITRKNIPYKKSRIYINNEEDKTQTSTTNNGISFILPSDITNDDSITKNINIISDYIETSINNVEETNTTITHKRISNCNIPIDFEDKDRFSPIKEEVDNVLFERFERENCSSDINYTFQDYIATIEMLIFLKKNSAEMIKCRKGQYGTMNAFQSDMIHTFDWRFYCLPCRFKI